MAYDPKCFDLAQAFLEDHADLNNADRRHELAQTIQRTIDVWIEDERQSEFERGPIANKVSAR